MKGLVTTIAIIVTLIIGVCGLDVYRNYCDSIAEKAAREWLADYDEMDHDSGTFTKISRVSNATYEIEFTEWTEEYDHFITIQYKPFSGLSSKLHGVRK